MRILFSILFFTAILASLCNKSQGNQAPGSVEIKDSVIASGLDHVWEMVWGNDNHIWITERGGRISRLDPGTGIVTTLYTIDEVVANGEGGLLGMALHPEFNNTPFVYVVYNYGSPYREKLVRFTYNGTSLIEQVTLLDNIDAASIHDGSRIKIGPDGKIYLTTGDAATQSLPQNPSSLNGKVLRLNLDGTVPNDNPVPGNPYWSLGHRNAQGMVFVGNKLFVSEHGANTDDEINLITKGGNYGWPNVEGYCDTPGENNFCDDNGIIEPIKAWTPTVAACGMEFYNNDAIPQWKNSLLMVSLKNRRLYQLKLNTAQTEITDTYEYFESDYGRLRAICVAPDGKVYIGTSNGGNDKIVVVR